MSAFTEAANWRYPKRGRYVVVVPLEWEVGKVGSGLWVRVPIGFFFDKTVPWWLRWMGFIIPAFNPHHEKHLKGAAMHDWTLAQGWDRVSAAAAASEAWRASGVRRFERLVLVLSITTYKWW